MKSIPFVLTVLALLFTYLPWSRTENEIEKAFRDALYAEEVKGDTEGALKAYQEVAAKFEQQRDMAATAIFRPRAVRWRTACMASTVVPTITW